MLSIFLMLLGIVNGIALVINFIWVDVNIREANRLHDWEEDLAILELDNDSVKAESEDFTIAVVPGTVLRNERGS